ncbi:type VII secretion-associated serine protease mycosin [Streptomyces sp. NPDC102467]|uniref:type VII secretion-associated serine protease mycosin n=1 Tax=Streptomyces sp. NPDC102467 TaxID=3366179 RepID=UPI00380B9BEF
MAAVLGVMLWSFVHTPAQAASTRDQQWHLTAMKAEEMWRTSKGIGVTVAVIGSGVAAANPDLRGRVLDGLDLADGVSGDEHSDYDGSGTGAAGLIAATGAYGGGQGAFGLAPGAKILPVRLPDPRKANMQGDVDAQMLKVAPKGIRYAADHGAKVIDVDQWAYKGSDQLTDAVDYALKKGALVFAPVGNDGSLGNELTYPAATPGVVGVGAVDKDGHVTGESAHGDQVDVVAPGKDMVHACGGKSGLCKTHGTQDASALAAAGAALIWAKHKDWTNDQVLQVVLNTISGPSNGVERSEWIGYGAVRPRIALKNPGNPGPADTYPLGDYPVAEVTHFPSPATPQTESGGPAAADGSTRDSGQVLLWAGVGVAGVLAGAGIAIPAVRSRKRRCPTPLLPPYAPHPHARADGDGRRP